MLDPATRAVDVAVSKTKDRAELLVWMGTAYGRTRVKEQPAPASVAKPKFTTLRPRTLAAYWLRRVQKLIRPWRNVTACLALAAAAGLSAISVADRLDTPATPVTAGLGVVVPAEPPHEEMAALPLKEPEPIAAPAVKMQVEDFERQAREAADVKAALATEREARLSAEAKTAQLTADAAAERQARQAAETAKAELSSELAATRKAKTDAEDAARLAARPTAETAWKTVISPPAAAATDPQPPAALQKPQIEPAKDTKEQATRPDISKKTAAKPAANLAEHEFQEGQRLFASGKLEAARQHFERAAASGSAEAALAAGNTFDPVSLTKAGLKQAGDPARARQWYRRAYELAQSRQ